MAAAKEKRITGKSLSKLTITGHLLHIINFSPNTGDLRLCGTIDSLVYADENKNRGSLLERVKGLLRTRLTLQKGSTAQSSKKGLVKGKTYTLKYKVRIKATGNFKATEYVTRTVKVKIK